MSMKFFTGLQDFLGLYDPSVTSISNSSPSSHIASLFGSATATNNRNPPPSQPQRKRAPSQINAQELGDERITRCSHSRNVHFPSEGLNLVSGYHEAPTHSFHLKQCFEADRITDCYDSACRVAKINPIASVERQLKCFHRVVGLRQECLSLKGQRLSQTHMECLEEIFRRVQFDTLDFEYTFIDDDAAVSLAEMLEFYDSTVKLNLSFNKQINIRGWQALFRAIKNCASLQMLNLRYTSLSDRAIPVLSRTLKAQPALTTLHLENVSLSGKNLLILVCALKTNIVLRELYLGENNLQPADGAHLYQMIVANTSIQMLDLRNNQLQDGGLRHICDALRHRETLANSSLSALVLWNNRLTSGCMDALASALMENSKLETLNIGNNNLSVEGIMALKPALLANSNLQRLGLQATNLDCQCAIVLAECLADNSVMVRVDLRDNIDIGSAGLLALHLAMKMNQSITLLNLDNSCANSKSAKVFPKVKEYNEQFKTYFDEIKSFCERNKQMALKKLCVQTSVTSECPSDLESPSGEPVERAAIEKKQEVEDITKNIVSTLKEEKEELVVEVKSKPLLSKQKSIDNQSPSKRPVWKFTRSSSLTCTELVEDINFEIQERIVQMSRSRSSLDASTDERPSSPLIQKVAVPLARAEMGRSPSLPALPFLAKVTDSTATIKKPPNRRFSVSLSTHSASSPDLRRAVSPRFKVTPVKAAPAPSQSLPSSPAMSQIVLEKKIVTPVISGAVKSKSLESTAEPSDKPKFVLADSPLTPRIVNVPSRKADENGNSTQLSEMSSLAGERGENVLKKKEDVDIGMVKEHVKGSESLSSSSLAKCGEDKDCKVLKPKQDGEKGVLNTSDSTGKGEEVTVLEAVSRKTSEESVARNQKSSGVKGVDPASIGDGAIGIFAASVSSGNDGGRQTEGDSVVIGDKHESEVANKHESEVANKHKSEVANKHESEVANKHKSEASIDIEETIDRLPQRVSADDNVQEAAQLSVKVVRFSESPPKEIAAETSNRSQTRAECVSEGGCANTGSQHSVPEVCKEYQNKEGVQCSPDSGVSGACGDAETSVNVRTDTPPSTHKVGSDVQNPSTSPEANEKMERRVAASPSGNGDCASTSASESQNLQKASESNNNERSEDSADSEDFVFVVNECNANENLKLPEGCNVEVVEQSPATASTETESVSVVCENDSAMRASNSHATDTGSSQRLAKEAILVDKRLRLQGVRTPSEKKTFDPVNGKEHSSIKKPPDIEDDNGLASSEDRSPPTKKSSNASAGSGETDDPKILESCESENLEDRALDHIRKLELLMTTSGEKEDGMIQTGEVENEAYMKAEDTQKGVERCAPMVTNNVPKRPMKDALRLLNLGSNVTDNETVRRVVTDLVNYTSFEMGDEDGFPCSGSKSPSPSRIASPMNERAPRANGSPPRAVATGTASRESDERVVHSVVRALVRDVLKQEKNFLSRSLRKKRERLNNKDSFSPDPK